MSCHTVVFADDTTVCCSVSDNTILNEFLDLVRTEKELILNEQKTTYLTFSLNEAFDNHFTKFLDINVDSRQWNSHTKDFRNKLSKSIFAIRNITKVLNTQAEVMAYHSLLHSSSTYGLLI